MMMKVLKLLTTAIIALQFIYQPIVYAQPFDEESKQLYSVNDVISKLKDLFQSKAFEGYKFLDKDKNEITADQLINLKDNIFYLLSPENELIEQFAIKVKVVLNTESESVSVALEIFDRDFKKSLGLQSFSIGSKVDVDKNIASIKARLKTLVTSANKAISRNPSSGTSETLAIGFLVVVSELAIYIGIAVAAVGFAKYGTATLANKLVDRGITFNNRLSRTHAKPKLVIAYLGLATVIIGYLAYRSSSSYYSTIRNVYIH